MERQAVPGQDQYYNSLQSAWTLDVMRQCLFDYTQHACPFSSTKCNRRNLGDSDLSFDTATILTDVPFRHTFVMTTCSRSNPHTCQSGSITPSHYLHVLQLRRGSGDAVGHVACVLIFDFDPASQDPNRP